MIPVWLQHLFRDPREGGVLGINRRNLDLVFSDYRPGKFRELDDKLTAKDILQGTGVSVPRTLAVVADRGDLDRLEELMADLDACVIKPVNGWGGRGILVLEKQDGIWTKVDGTPIEPARVRDQVADILAGIHSLNEESDRALIEELIRPHVFFAELAPAGLCDLRIVVEKGVAIQAMARVPTLASDGKANLHGGGVGLGIDLRDGRVTGAIVKDRPVENHPDTGAPLIGLQMPDWVRCRELAVAAAGAFDLEYVGVDIVVDATRGPLILEVNARPGLAIQIANATSQTVSTKFRESVSDRATSLFNWVLMLALVSSPLLYHWWQAGHVETIIVKVGPESVRESVAVGGRENEVDPSAPDATSDFQSEELSLAETSGAFAAARAAADHGDTSAALGLYLEVLDDPDLAPFALNNMAVLARRSGRDSMAIVYLKDAVARYPNYQRAHFNLGLSLKSADRPAEAEKSLRRALELKPNHDRAWSALGGLLTACRKYDDAVEAFGKAIRYDPTATESRFRLGLTLRMRGSLAEARSTFTDLAALDPGHEGAAYWLARTGRDLALDAGPDPDSLAAWRTVLEPFLDDSNRCLSLSGVLAAESGDPVAALPVFEKLSRSRYRPNFHRLALADVALDLGLWDQSLDAAARAAGNNPIASDRFVLLAELGRFLSGYDDFVADPEPRMSPMVRLVYAAAIGDAGGVRRLLNEIEEGAWPAWLAAEDSSPAGLRLPGDLEPFSPVQAPLDTRLDPEADPPYVLQLYLGLVLADRRGDKTAAAGFRTVLLETAPDFDPLKRLAFARAVASDSLEQARTLGDELLALDDDPVLVLEVAEVHCCLGDTRHAKKLLASLPKSLQTHPAARSLAGRLAVQEKKYEEAVRILRRSLEKAPSDILGRYALAKALLALGRTGQAEAELRRTIDLAPDRIEVRKSLADLLTGQRRYDEATAAWAEVLALDSDELSARFKYALSLQRSGNEVGALAAYDDLLARDPGRTSALFNRGLALERLGRNQEAIQAFTHLLVMVPDHEAGQAHLARLQGDTR